MNFLAQYGCDKRPKIIALVLATMVAGSGCSSFDVINATSTDRAFVSKTDIAFGPDPRQRLNLYTPRKPIDNSPVVLFFYGGGWRDGSKEDYEFVASALVREGISVVIPDYRLYPDVQFPDFVGDAAKAARWIHDNGARHGLRPGPFYLMGHSAGAHIAAMLATDKRYLAVEEIDPQLIAAWIGLSGPYDFLPLATPGLEAIFPPRLRHASQPVRFVSPQTPPALLIHGDDDDVVYWRNSANMASVLQANGVDVEFKTYAGTGHARVVAALAPPLQWAAPTLADVTRYINRAETLQRGGEAAP